MESVPSDLDKFLSQMIERHLRQAQPSAAPTTPALPPMCGLPSWPATTWPQPQMPLMPSANTTYQPTGASVAIQVPLPDGRSVSMRVHFGAEAAQNLPALALQCMAMFGQYLSVRPARAPNWNGGWNYNSGHNGYGGYSQHGRWRR